MVIYQISYKRDNKDINAIIVFIYAPIKPFFETILLCKYILSEYPQKQKYKI